MREPHILLTKGLQGLSLYSYTHLLYEATVFFSFALSVQICEDTCIAFIRYLLANGS
jgi:hypothetical protein